MCLLSVSFEKSIDSSSLHLIHAAIHISFFQCSKFEYSVNRTTSPLLIVETADFDWSRLGRHANQATFSKASRLLSPAENRLQNILTRRANRPACKVYHHALMVD